MLLAIDSDKDFIDIEVVAIALVPSFQSACINGTELNAPQADAFSADSDASFSQEILDIAVAQVEAIVQPNSVGDDAWRESVAFVCVHPPILANMAT